MSSSLHDDPWQALDQELNAWRQRRRVATLWWRDDDAVAASDPLNRLSQLAGRFDVPISLAVVPRDASVSLHDSLSGPNFALQHGWAHHNHAPLGEKAAELGRHRALEVVLAELGDGLERLRGLLGDRLLPVLVPPWNRIDDAVIARLPQLGLRGLSTFTPRPAAAVGGLVQVNAHVDPIAWRRGGKTRSVRDVCAQFVEHLEARRNGDADPDEPTGLLTHHLQHDEAMWQLLPLLLERLSSYGQWVRWVSAREAFAFD